MDAASAAAMSDPDRNRWFRRRWQDDPGPGPPPREATSPLHNLELTGHQLLLQWRLARAQQQGSR